MKKKPEVGEEIFANLMADKKFAPVHLDKTIISNKQQPGTDSKSVHREKLTGTYS